MKVMPLPGDGVGLGVGVGVGVAVGVGVGGGDPEVPEVRKSMAKPSSRSAKSQPPSMIMLVLLSVGFRNFTRGTPLSGG